MPLGSNFRKETEHSLSWGSYIGSSLPLSQRQKPQNHVQEQNLDNVLPHTAEAGGSSYYIGDVYAPQEQKRPWELNTDHRPYLKYVKDASLAWPTLSYLANWMEVTTSPLKWRHISAKDRDTRAKRTRVALIDFPKDINGKPERRTINSVEELHNLFAEPTFNHNPDHSRLFVVEDLSRDLIEALGSAYDVDPLFWRGHISDYLWFNTRDPWVELEELPHITQSRNYFNFRYAHPRYFKGRETKQYARREAGSMNVLRRLDDDGISTHRLDEESAEVCLFRAKASFWIRPNTETQKHALGILVVYPSIKEGYPLWGRCYNFDSPQSFPHKNIPKPPPRDSLFESAIHWTMRMSMQQFNELGEQPNNLAVAILSIIGTEWLTVKEYITTRLTQIEWEVEVPDFRAHGKSYGLETTLKWLHPFRRNIPRYRKWVDSVLNGILSNKNLGSEDQALRQLRDDYLSILNDLDTVHAQVQDLVRVVTAIISIEDAKRTGEQNSSLARLTYLAVVFVPLSFVASFFSMSSDIKSLSTTYWVYFAVAVPLTLLSLSVVRWWDIAEWFRRDRK